MTAAVVDLGSAVLVLGLVVSVLMVRALRTVIERLPLCHV
jgi:hypothetical protein